MADERLKQIIAALERFSSTCSYSAATVAPGNRAGKDGEWVKVHGGRADSAHNQLSRAERELEAALSLARSMEKEQGWRSLTDREWVNIVNSPEVQQEHARGDHEIAVNAAVRLTEAKLREKNAPPPHEGQG